MIAALPSAAFWAGHFYVASQCCSAIALCCGSAAFMAHSDRKLKRLLSASNYMQALHFLLLGAFAGAVMGSFVGTRNLVASRGLSWPRFWGFALAGTALGLWACHDRSDGLLVLANMLACRGVFTRTGLSMRVWLAASGGCWLVYNMLHHSLMGVGLEAFFLFTNGVSILKIYAAEQKKPLNFQG